MVNSDAEGGEIGLEPDYTPIDSGVLQTYPLPPQTTMCDESPITAIGEREVSVITPLGNGKIRDREDYVLDREHYVLEVEYRVEELALRESSLGAYCGTFEGARITQEAITQMVHKHLKDALDTGDVFVEVRSESCGKRTRVGSVL